MYNIVKILLAWLLGICESIHLWCDLNHLVRVVLITAVLFRRGATVAADTSATVGEIVILLIGQGRALLQLVSGVLQAGVELAQQGLDRCQAGHLDPKLRG